MQRHGARLAVILTAAAALLCLFACAAAAPVAGPVQTPQASLVPTAVSMQTPVPTAAVTDTPAPSAAPVTLIIRFAGDIMVSKPMINGAALPDGGYDFDYIWDAIRPELAKADLMIGNLETSVAGYENGGFTGFPRFNAPDEYLYAVRNAGFNVLTNANNHLLDRGVAGALTTVRKIRAQGFLHTGVYLSPEEERILLTDVRGVRVALLAYSYRQADKEQPGDEDAMQWLTNFNDPAQMAQDIASARAMGADVVLVFTHMGMEGTYVPSRQVRAMARHLADSGADAAIFCHSHAVQPFDRLETADGRRVFVAYALGNFLCDGKYPMSRSGMILELPVTFDPASGAVSVDNVRYVPTYSHGEGDEREKRFTLFAAGLAMEDAALPQRTRNLARISWETVTDVVGEEYAAAVKSLQE